MVEVVGEKDRIEWGVKVSQGQKTQITDTLKSGTLEAAIDVLENKEFKKILLPAGDRIAWELTKNMLLLADRVSIVDSIEQTECFILVETPKKHSRVHNSAGGLTPRHIEISLRGVGSTEGDLRLRVSLCKVSRDAVDFETHIRWRMILNKEQQNYIISFLRNQGIISEISL